MRGLSFAARLARREARTGARRIGVFMLSITLGVGALVAIHSFREDVLRSIRIQARTLLGADLRISAGRPLPDSAVAVVDALRREGADVAGVTTAVSMVLAPSNENVRLLQVKGVDGGWPFYGAPVTTPDGAWGRHLDGASAIVDPAVLVQLDVALGDSLVVGERTVEIVATAADLPAELGFQTAVGPRVWISGDVLRDAGLLGFGSLARYERYLRLPEGVDADDVERRHRAALRGLDVAVTTADEQARDLTRALDYLGRYLGLVGLAALLLGGIGVASAVHVYVQEKRDAVAVLRCIGARQANVFGAYLFQVAVLGAVGAGLGVVLGVAAQQLLPALLENALPVDVEPRVSLSTMAIGLGVGLWVALLFALGPLLRIRDVPPLAALRQDFGPEDGRGTGPLRWLVYGALGATVLGLSVFEAPDPEEGIVFGAALLGVTGLLALTAEGITRATRRFFPRRAPYPVRQGVSNLFRPRNQTWMVTLALGFGAFVVGTLSMVQSSIGGTLRFEEQGEVANLLVFDIQQDQVEGVREMLPEGGREAAVVTPMVPARIASIRGLEPDELRSDTVGRRPARWALGRDYRHTYRWEVSETEEVVAGRWHAPGTGKEGDGSAERPARVSVEADLAEDLGVELGDRITWDVGGRRVVSVVTSLRRVDWERFSTNFFVVFEPGALDDAPQMSILLTTVPDDRLRAAFQRDLVRRFPNVSAIDLARIRETVGEILGEVSRVVRFLALFAGVAALVVLGGALATTRAQRTRESALLRTLGARRGQLLAVLVTEYLALGSVAALAGLALAGAAAFAMVRGMFEIPFVATPGTVIVIWAVVTGLTVAVGLLGSRGVLAKPPLPVLRSSAG